jgi:hypothetical protein
MSDTSDNALLLRLLQQFVGRISEASYAATRHSVAAEGAGAFPPY